jgi:hypothetical protein
VRTLRKMAASSAARQITAPVGERCTRSEDDASRSMIPGKLTHGKETVVTLGNDMLPEVRKLREIVWCRHGVPLDVEPRRWLATSFQNFLDHPFLSVHDAPGLHAPKGGVPWWLEEGLCERNAALREMAERFYPTASASRQACLIRAAALHHAASAWLHDRNNSEMPAHYRATPKECLWWAFMSQAPMPVGEREPRSIFT